MHTPELIRWENGLTIVELYGPEDVVVLDDSPRLAIYTPSGGRDFLYVVVSDDHGTRLAVYSGHGGRDFELLFLKGAGEGNPDRQFSTLEALLQNYGICSESVEKSFVLKLVGLARLANHFGVETKKEGNLNSADYYFVRAATYLSAARTYRKK